MDPQPSSMSSTSSSPLLPLLQSTAWAQHYRKRMQRSKWEAPDRFNHAARISDLCKELLIYDTSCQSGRFWNNKCFRRRRASTFLDLLFLEFIFLFVCICCPFAMNPTAKPLDKAHGSVSQNPVGLFQTSRWRRTTTENTIQSAFCLPWWRAANQLPFSFDESRM